jgi:hypothetical protein
MCLHLLALELSRFGFALVIPAIRLKKLAFLALQQSTNNAGCTFVLSLIFVTLTHHCIL